LKMQARLPEKCQNWGRLYPKQGSRFQGALTTFSPSNC